MQFDCAKKNNLLQSKVTHQSFRQLHHCGGCYDTKNNLWGRPNGCYDSKRSVRLLRHKKRSVRLLNRRGGCYDTKNDLWGRPRGCYDSKRSVEAIELSPPHLRLLHTWLQQEKFAAAPYRVNRVATQKQEMKNNLKSTRRNKFSILFSIRFIL